MVSPALDIVTSALGRSRRVGYAEIAESDTGHSGVHRAISQMVGEWRLPFSGMTQAVPLP